MAFETWIGIRGKDSDVTPPFPPYNLDRLVRLARQQLRAAGKPADALAVYHEVAKLRREELRAAAAVNRSEGAQKAPKGE